jgi:polysaccharide export outer membrane protein
MAGRTPAPVLAEMKVVPEDFPKLRLAPGFLVNMSVLDDADFSGVFRVDEKGYLPVPVLGRVYVAGETAAEATEQIRKRLQAEQLLRDPQVTLNVIEYIAPEVAILGEVTVPGKYSLLTSKKLIDVLALAGGTTLLAGNEVRIIPISDPGAPKVVHYSRGTNPEVIEGVYVHPGDTVQVKRAGIVYVMGAVTRPGGYVMQEEGTLNILQAISLANGTTPVASTKNIYLLRNNPDGTSTFMTLSYKGITQGKHSDMQLHATDVLFVPTNRIKESLITSQGIIASVASTAIYVAAVH